MSSAGPALYNDLNKRTIDLLTKDFPTTPKIEFKPKLPSGLGFDASVVEKDASLVGTVTPKYQFEHAVYGSTLLSLSTNTKRNLKVEATSTELAKGLKVILTATGSQTVSAGFEYKQPSFSANSTLNLISPKGSTGVFATVLGYQGHHIGLQTDFNVSTNTLNDINANVTINPDHHIQLGLFARFKKNTIGGRVFHQTTKNIAFAAEAEANYLNNNETPKFTVGLEYAIDSNNTVKGKIDTNGTVGASFITKLNEHVKLAFATSLNTDNLSAASKSSYGFSITIE